MNYDYTVVSPSLSGILSHESLSYDGLRRPVGLMRACDGPAQRNGTPRSAEEERLLVGYFSDLYLVFMKKLSAFIVESESSPDDTVKLQAMLQEMIKVKKILRTGAPAVEI